MKKGEAYNYMTMIVIFVLVFALGALLFIALKEKTLSFGITHVFDKLSTAR